MKIITLLSLILMISFNKIYHSYDYIPSSDYSIQFSTKKVEGVINGLSGQVQFDPENPGSSNIDVKVDVSTIETGNKKKDKHAKNKPWLNSELYPYISFKAQRVDQAEDRYQMVGELQIKDVVRNVTIPFSAEKSSGLTTLEGSFMLNRKEYNIKGNAIGFLVGKDIAVKLKIPVGQY